MPGAPPFSVENARRRRRHHASDLLLQITMPLATLAVLLVIWILLASRTSTLILPGPDRVWSAFVVSWQQDVIQPAFVTTLVEAVAGWAIGSAVALPLSYLVSRWTLLDRALSPYLAASQAMPIIAIAPLLFIWLSFGMELKVVVAALIAFFPVTRTTSSGLRAVNKDLREVAQVFGASWHQMLLYVELPLTARWILSGERIAIALAVTGAFVGELVNPDAGLGAMIVNDIQNFETSTVFAAVIALMVMGAALYGAVGLLERMILRWTD